MFNIQFFLQLFYYSYVLPGIHLRRGTIYLFASFSVARVSHDDEAKLINSRERTSDPSWVASKEIGRGEGSGRGENAADKAGRRWQTG